MIAQKSIEKKKIVELLDTMSIPTIMMAMIGWLNLRHIRKGLNNPISLG
jgi:hypothetical protein